MKITRNSVETNQGSRESFTGAVYIDAVAIPSGTSRLNASTVHFTPGGRTAWHTHPNGQTIYVIEGIGRAQRRGGPIEVIRPGDRVFFEPGDDLGGPAGGRPLCPIRQRAYLRLVPRYAGAPRRSHLGRRCREGRHLHGRRS